MKLWCSSRSRIGPVLVLLTLIQIFSLTIFLKGFLLTRQTLNDLTGHVYPAWDRFPLHHSTPSPISPPSIPSRPPFKRTILILIDALRFDFVFPNTTSDAFFLNQLPIMHQLRQSHPELSLLFQFRADPPTTTMQRIKGLMTGSLPTFIDAGANFASSAVAEDHLLRHIAHRYRNRYFMGDDTWVHLFPESFVDHQTWPLDSFKMLDLDSVDDAIEARLWPLLSEKTDWELLIAHFLGVDHCGHTYGPSDPNMSRKLQQMNTVIERLAEYVDDDTLLVVMGDHGMSVEGDHGGESIEELTSTLFLHSGRQLTDRKNEAFYKRLHDERAHLLGYDLAEVTRRLHYDGTIYPMVAQIHLVPTLSYLLQVPIPSGNLGALIPEVVYPMEHYEKDDRLWHMVEQFRLNALQVHDYLEQYAKHTHHLDFSEEKLRPMRAHLYEAEEIVYQSIQQHQQQKNTTQQLEEAILAYDRFLISTIKYCEAIWAQFDTGSMILGLVLLGLSTLLTLLVALKMTWFTTWTKMLTIVLGVSSVTSLLGYYFIDGMVESIPMHWFEKMGKMDWIGTFVVLTVLLGSIVMLLWKRQTKATATAMLILIVGIIAQACTLGSNSFVVWEDRGTEFILATLSVAWIVKNLKSSTHDDWKAKTLMVLKPLLFLSFVRLLSVTGQCREEQFPHCNYLQSSQLLEFGFETVRGYITIAILIITYGFIVYHFGILYREQGVVVAGSYQICGLIVLVRMVDEIAQKYMTEHGGEFPPVWRTYMDVYLPRVLYGTSVIGSLMAWWTNSHESRRRLGWSLLLLASTVLAILQRPLGATIMMTVSPLLISLLCEDNTDWIHVCLLHFLGHHLFFVTGHQATFTSLPWKAAFVGFDEMNYYGGLVLVLLSTFAGYIMSWIGLLMMDSRPSLYYLLILFEAVPTFLCAVFIFVLRRHLMTWKIFAPRFLFQILLNIGAHVAAILLEIK